MTEISCSRQSHFLTLLHFECKGEGDKQRHLVQRSTVRQILEVEKKIRILRLLKFSGRTTSEIKAMLDEDLINPAIKENHSYEGTVYRYKTRIDYKTVLATQVVLSK
ncbi:unnamed protein product [Lepeophtheirus salmonis]|uniref:(salmon louse) hypothetical protein n=1 Tax=Lepeophtheirus salmonis TaxID=72036 RepID=A0A7R8H8Y6_LEPSM|nr:unnamed protein product [Lepeophtheirus salmonis]CAF2947734.1 unnamed protein product [Lepeophtheirus salmonis]